MAAQEAAPEFSREQLAAQMAAAEVIDFPRPYDGDFFTPTSPNLPYDIEITDWRDKKPVYHPGVGQTETSIVRLRDKDSQLDSRFVFKKFVPDEQRWEVSTDSTPPLGIRVKGFPTYLGLQLAEAGIHNRVVGTNQEHGHSLLHDAQASLLILGQDDKKQRETGNQTCAPNQSNFVGYSMGAMKFLAMLGVAPEMERSVDFSVGLDPCLVNPVDYKHELADAPNLIKYIGREALQIPINMGKNIRLKTLLADLSRSLHMAESIGFTPEYLSNLYDKWNVLATGETRDFPPNVPKEAVVALHFFDGCRWNDSQEYDRLFSGHTNVRRVHEDGLHLSGANSEVIGRVVAKNVLGLDLSLQKVAASELANALGTPILAA